MHRKPVNLWWGPPRNFNERKNQRKISWLELFYDLVYVAAIGQLTHHLSDHFSGSSLALYALLFCLLFWSWVNGSQYYDLHGSDSIRTRLLTFWQMLAVAALAVTLGAVFEGRQQGFAITFAVVQVLITYLWWSVGLYDRSHRVFNIFYTVNYLLALALILVSLFTSDNAAYWLWSGALLLNLTPGLTGARTIVRVLKQRGQIFTASEALVERFGLFTIIVLAESVLGTVSGLSEVHGKIAADWIAFALGILISFLLWSLYFDMTSEQETKAGYAYLQGLIFLHFPLLGAFGVAGACLRSILAGIQQAVAPGVYWTFCISLSIVLCMITGIAAIMKEEEEDRSYIRPVSRWLLVTAAILLLLPLGIRWLKGVVFLAAVAVILTAPVVAGIRSWVRYKISSSNT